MISESHGGDLHLPLIIYGMIVEIILGIKECCLTIKHLQFCWALYRSAGCGELPLGLSEGENLWSTIRVLGTLFSEKSMCQWIGEKGKILTGNHGFHHKI